jgi:hypothetical protein
MNNNCSSAFIHHFCCADVYVTVVAQLGIARSLWQLIVLRYEFCQHSTAIIIMRAVKPTLNHDFTISTIDGYHKMTLKIN